MDLNYLFRPRSIAIIGASRDKSKIGHSVLLNLKAAGFKGNVYPVNPKAKKIAGLRSYASVQDITSVVDVVIISVPASIVATVLEDCGKKKIPFAIILTAGFKETDTAGAALEASIVAIARQYRIQIVGPNCLGIINTHWHMNASFAAGQPLPGPIGFISQSGAMMVSLLDWSGDAGLGISSMISVGNEAGVRETDLLEYFLHDARTTAVGMYIEHISNAPQFMAVVSKLTKKKPVVILKAGRNVSAQKAVLSHTGGLAQEQAVLSALFKQVGAIEVDNIEDLFNVLKYLSFGVPKVNRPLLIVSNAGGPAIASVDALRGDTIILQQIPKQLRLKLEKIVPSTVAIANPLDIRGDAPVALFAKVLDILMSELPAVTILVLATPQSVTPMADLARAIVVRGKKHPGFIVVSFIGGVHVRAARGIIRQAGMLEFDFPHDAIHALELSHSYTADHHVYQAPVLDQQAASGKQALLGYAEVTAALCAARLPLLLGIHMQHVSEVKRLNRFPVVFKVLSKKIIHKEQAGAIRMNIHTADEARVAFLGLQKLFPHNDGILSQPHYTHTNEFFIGFKHEPGIGTVILFGAGGTHVERIRDISMRIAPITTVDAASMIASCAAASVIAPAERKILLQLILQISDFARKHPSFTELDCNPVVFHANKLCILDARIVAKK